jgi:hypothetical protein
VGLRGVGGRGGGRGAGGARDGGGDTERAVERLGEADWEAAGGVGVESAAVGEMEGVEEAVRGEETEGLPLAVGQGEEECVLVGRGGVYVALREGEPVPEEGAEGEREMEGDTVVLGVRERVTLSVGEMLALLQVEGEGVLPALGDPEAAGEVVGSALVVELLQNVAEGEARLVALGQGVEEGEAREEGVEPP